MVATGASQATFDKEHGRSLCHLWETAGNLGMLNL